MDTLKSADVIIADFPEVTGVKRRPAVVISTTDYHTTVGDVILGAVTTNLTIATTPTDHLIADWTEAGLRRPSAFRSFLVTPPQSKVLAIIGSLSSSDWQKVQACIRQAIAI
ncbi:MAG: type II toxin-antitoxin system PemK/MazF family toxin [Candidatus Poribacteria bacterium]|nr:type II toxin-antitoxin system PemK/MazF family toxin [Candidatus Poribacteria bacterium]